MPNPPPFACLIDLTNWKLIWRSLKNGLWGTWRPFREAVKKNKNTSLDLIQRGGEGSRVKSKLGVICVFFRIKTWTYICPKKTSVQTQRGEGGVKGEFGPSPNWRFFKFLTASLSSWPKNWRMGSSLTSQTMLVEYKWSFLRVGWGGWCGFI